MSSPAAAWPTCQASHGEAPAGVSPTSLSVVVVVGSDTGNMFGPENHDDRADADPALVAGDKSVVTAFGSSRRSPIAAAALLRATAAAAGAGLRDASDVDLVAATIAAECWMSALNAKSLAQPVRYGTPAVAALAALLARAAGIAEVQECPALAAAEQDVDKIRQVEMLGGWAVQLLGVEAPEVLRRAAADLSAGSLDFRLEAMAGLLIIVAENLGLDR
jgi:hypothetical protein